MQKITYILFIALAALFFAACSNTRHLPKGESLFKGSKVIIKDRQAPRKERKVLQNDLVGVVRPKPNSKFLGMRLKLRIYNMVGESKGKKGFRRWLREKVGEPPVLASSVRMDNNKALMLNVLENRGFFYGTVTAEMKTDTNRKKSTAVFNVTTGSQYKILKAIFRKDSNAVISRDVDSIFQKTLLKPGTPYNLDVIKAERERIDRGLKEMGYFYFRPDYILVVVDSSIGDHKVNMYVRLKHREIPPEAYRAYSINDIYIYANFRLRGRAQDTATDSMVTIDNYHVIDRRKTFKPTNL